ncbi:MAG: class I SAM-dependent methyltransferase [Thermoleophilaceae bacterium]
MSAALDSVTQFHAQRPDDLRRAPRSHRLSYVIRALPAALEELSAELPRSGHVLDYGCADVPYRRLFAPDARYEAADLPGNPDATVELLPDGSLPHEDDSFDAVLSTQVLEHVEDPDLYLAECFRVLRPGGRMLLSTHGIMVLHPDPVDYWRWTCDGLRRAVREAGFEVVRFEGVVGLAATGLQLVQDDLVYRLPRWLRKPFALAMQTLIGWVDRFQSAESRRFNALVFALVAVKP